VITRNHEFAESVREEQALTDITVHLAFSRLTEPVGAADASSPFNADKAWAAIRESGAASRLRISAEPFQQFSDAESNIKRTEVPREIEPVASDLGFSKTAVTAHKRQHQTLIVRPHAALVGAAMER